MTIDLDKIAKRFSDDDTARAYLEGLRWTNGVVCPHCGQRGAYRLEARTTSKKPGRKGLWKCKDPDCGSQFTVTVGTIFEDSHIPLSKWLLAFHLLSSSKKGMSAHQLHRMLGMTYRSAWFMAHRIRYAMAQPPYTSRMKGTIEIDETFVGGRTRGSDKYRIYGQRREPVKTPVVALVQRGSESRSFAVADVKSPTVQKIVKEHIDEQSHLISDDSRSLHAIRRDYASYQTIRHSAGEYGRGTVHTNTVEGYFSLLKRSIIGTYHHVSVQHLQRYLHELDFRYSRRSISDGERTQIAIRSGEGKRLMYRDTKRHLLGKETQGQIGQPGSQDQDNAPGN